MTTVTNYRKISFQIDYFARFSVICRYNTGSSLELDAFFMFYVSFLSNSRNKKQTKKSIHQKKVRYTDSAENQSNVASV